MFRIRFHGRGGQGMKTASRILGTAFFREGFEVQDAPRYGAERRGAPIFAYVRADDTPILERGVITHPDLVAVADETLVGIPAAGVLQGLDRHCVLLIVSSEAPLTWAERLKTPAHVVTLPPFEAAGHLPFMGVACAAASARLTGAVGEEALKTAIEQELASHGDAVIAENLIHATNAYDAVAADEGCVEQVDFVPEAVQWIEVPFDPADVSAPTIHKGATSVLVRTGLWRTMRPVLDADICKKCTWVCSSVCPDGVINVDASGFPDIDYDHCKGCMVCVVQCPRHALVPIAEKEAAS